jgi:hypothetical protein
VLLLLKEPGALTTPWAAMSWQQQQQQQQRQRWLHQVMAAADHCRCLDPLLLLLPPC